MRKVSQKIVHPFEKMKAYMVDSMHYAEKLKITQNSEKMNEV